MAITFHTCSRLSGKTTSRVNLIINSVIATVCSGVSDTRLPGKHDASIPAASNARQISGSWLATVTSKSSSAATRSTSRRNFPRVYFQSASPMANRTLGFEECSFSLRQGLSFTENRFDRLALQAFAYFVLANGVADDFHARHDKHVVWNRCPRRCG